jgi:putative transposase
LRLAREKPLFGYRRLQDSLYREGERVNHKRVYRLYRELGLCLKRRKRKHCVRCGLERKELTGANQEWALDFAHDVLATGRTIRVLSVMDVYTQRYPRGHSAPTRLLLQLTTTLRVRNDRLG